MQAAGLAAGDITRALERSLRDSDCLDLESLCVAAGSSAWAVACDLVLVDYDGNAADACILAAVMIYSDLYAWYSDSLFGNMCIAGGVASVPSPRGDSGVRGWR